MEHSAHSDTGLLPPAELISEARRVVRWMHDPELPPLDEPAVGKLYAGVDLGTAYLSLIVVDEAGTPIAGEYEFAQVVKDGLVVDYAEAVNRIRHLKDKVERRICREITHAASAYPPGVPLAEVRATANVVEAAGIQCIGLIDEPSAANKVLRITEGAVVDVGGGTTGTAVIKDGKVVETADDPTGGTHFSLVIAGALDIPFEAAEALKTNPAEQQRLFPVIRPVMEKVGSLVQSHLAGHETKSITLVGGTSAYPGMDQVIANYTGLNVKTANHPVLITPLGIALECKQSLEQL